MVVVGSYRYDIVADTSKFTAGMVATRRELSAARKLFMAGVTDAQKLSMSINQTADAFTKGALNSRSLQTALKGLSGSTLENIKNNRRAAEALRERAAAMKQAARESGKLSMADQAQVTRLRRTASELDNRNVLLATRAKREKFVAEGREKQRRQQEARERRASAFGTFKTVAGFAALYGGARQISAGLADAMEIETTQAQFATMTGSAAQAAALMTQLRQFDAQTVFSFTDTIQGAKRLMNYGVAAEDVVDVLSRLGDISGGSADRLHGLTLAFGQATSLGRLQREEVNQMVERGFNPMMEITKLTGETMEELSKRMQRGGVSASELRDAINSATNAGGRFFGMMEKGSKTTEGRLRILRGEWEMIRADLSTAALPSLETGAKAATGFLNFFNSTLPNLVMTQPGVARTFSGRRVYAEPPPPSQRSTGNAFGIASGVAGRLGGVALGAAQGVAGGLMGLGQGAMNVGRQALLESQLSDLLRQYNQIQERTVNAIQPATAAARGSREEFQLRSQMARNREQKNEERKRHEEAQAKRDALIEAMNAIRQKLEMPTLVPGN